MKVHSSAIETLCTPSQLLGCLDALGVPPIETAGVVAGLLREGCIRILDPEPAPRRPGLTTDTSLH